MKPVEYEDPNKGLSSSGDYGDSSSTDDATPSSSAAAAADDASKPTWEGPCKAKKCGETCSECPPGDENCVEVLVLKQCDLKGACVPAKVECSVASAKDSKSTDKSSK
jgi:hypothetical protein